MTYADYERTVYDFLLARQREAADLRFSTRRKASSTAAGDIFIGTERSGRFSTTFWTLPVSYPGAAGDLIRLVFGHSHDGYTYQWEASMDRQAATTDQQRAALLLVEKMRTVEHPLWLRSSSSAAGTRTERTVVAGKERAYANLEHLLADVLEELPAVLPEVDRLIAEVKTVHPDFTAHRITAAEFERMQERLQRRLADQAETTGAIDDPPLLHEPKANYSAASNPYTRPVTAPLNQVLYGPPGTGKTYESITEAVRIANPAFPVDERSRPELRQEYQRLVEEGRIVFTTFHQSLTYEDFVEGLKPVLEASADGSGQLSYRVVPGIFRQLVDTVIKANRTAADPLTANGLRIDKQLIRKAAAFQLSLPREGADAGRYHYWMTENCITLPVNAAGTSMLSVFTDTLGEGDVLLVNADPYTLRAVGVVTGAYHHTPDTAHPHRRPVRWLYRDLTFPVPRLYGGQPFPTGSINRLDEQRLRAGLLREYDYRPAANNYVLIIDELSRGDVSRIFGELITLLEPDKRAGAPEELSAVLPYSREPFAVPDNLYVIATMNTVDRSVVSLDAALRRRFVFRKLAPQPELLEGRRVGGIDLAGLLTTLNNRLRRLTAPPQLLGHAYLMAVHTPGELRDAFAHRLLPLLEELLYDDPELLREVIGPGFFVPEATDTDGQLTASGESSAATLLDVAAMATEQFIGALQQLA